MNTGRRDQLSWGQRCMVRGEVLSSNTVLLTVGPSHVSPSQHWPSCRHQEAPPLRQMGVVSGRQMGRGSGLLLSCPLKRAQQGPLPLPLLRLLSPCLVPGKA